MTATQLPYCGFHHGPADQCPPFDPDLGDLIPDLLARGVDLQLVPQPRHTERCEDCIADGRTGIADAVAYVAHRAPSEALPDGFVYRPPVCVEHLWDAVVWEQRRGSPCWIEIFHDFAAAAS